MSGRIHLLRDETPNWLSITKWSAQKSYTIHIQVALNELSRLCVCVSVSCMCPSQRRILDLRGNKGVMGKIVGRIGKGGNVVMYFN